MSWDAWKIEEIITVCVVRGVLSSGGYVGEVLSSLDWISEVSSSLSWTRRENTAKTDRVSPGLESINNNRRGAGPYRGTGHKFCRFHKRGLPPSPPVEPTKLMPCTSV